MTQFVSVAETASNRSIDAYFDGISTVVERQRALAQKGSERMFAVLSGQAAGMRQLTKIYRSAEGEAVHAAAASSRLVRRGETAAGKATSQAVVSASDTVAATTGEQAGPARWTSDAYDALTAAEINEKLPQLSQSELAEVSTYESAHQARQTVLNRVTALQGELPLPGYDELNVGAIQKLLVAGDEQLAQRVRDYERAHKSRQGVLNATEAKLEDN